MPITYTVEVESALLLVKWTGPIGTREMADFSSLILADPRMTGCCRSITDVSESEILLSGEQLQAATEKLFAAAKARGKVWRTAVVAKSPVHFGVARQHEIVSQDLKSTGVFANEHEARAWVLAQ